MALKDIQKPRRILTLYHGSPITNIEKFDVAKSRKSFLDFGKGIYFTTNELQAMLWSINKCDSGAVYTVQVDTAMLNLKQYLTYSDEFVNTFCMCRAGFEDELADINGYDSIYGYVIDNDRESIVKKTNDYALGLANAVEVRNTIRVFDNKDQMCIKTQDLLDRMPIKDIRYTQYVSGYPRNDRRAVRWKK